MTTDVTGTNPGRQDPVVHQRVQQARLAALELPDTDHEEAPLGHARGEPLGVLGDGGESEGACDPCELPERLGPRMLDGLCGGGHGVLGAETL